MLKAVNYRTMDNLEEIIIENFLESSIQVRNSGVFRFPSAYRFENHNHKEMEINYIRSGHCIIGLKDSFIPLKPGDCVIISPGVPHYFVVDSREKCSITQLEFSVQVPNRLEEELAILEQEKMYYKLTNCEMTGYLMESLCRMNRMETDSRPIQLKLGFFQLFVELSAQITAQKQIWKKKGKAGRISELISYINENYEQQLKIEELARKFDVSSRYIRKCFIQETGDSCQHYINMLRIGKAKELLWFTGSTVTEIAMKTGFNSSQYFCRTFQQYVEMSPLEYRNLWRGSKAEELCVLEL